MVDLPVGTGLQPMIRLFRVFVPTSILLLLLSEIAVIFISFLAALYIFLPYDPDIFFLYEEGFLKMSLVALAIILGYISGFLYGRQSPDQSPRR